MFKRYADLFSEEEKQARRREWREAQREPMAEVTARVQ
jgi:hypothetical protein